MSKAPPDSCEKCSARSTRRNISSLSTTGAAAARRLMRESSEPGLCGLIVRSMRCISAITASAAAMASDRPSHHNSTRMAVPMMASSRVNHPGTSAGRAAERTEFEACTAWPDTPNFGAGRLPSEGVPKNMAPPKHQGRAPRRCCDWPGMVIDARLRDFSRQYRRLASASRHLQHGRPRQVAMHPWRPALDRGRGSYKWMQT